MRLDLGEPANVMAMTLGRRVLRRVGDTFNRRIDYYTLVLFAFGLYLVGLLNVRPWCTGIIIILSRMVLQ